MKLEELSFKDDDYHVYQKEVLTTIISQFSKIQDYSDTIVMPHYLLAVN